MTKYIFLSILLFGSLSCTKKETSKEVSKEPSSKLEESGQCQDEKLVYKTCTSQLEIYRQAIASAKANGKYLLVKFGFESCAWCQNLHKVFHGALKDKLSAKYQVSEINIRTSSGKQVFNLIKGRYPAKAEDTGYPFLVIVDPTNGQSAFQETGALEDNSSGKAHHVDKVYAAIEKARLSL